MTHPALWRRLAAMVYDGLILLAISMLYGFSLIAINFAINGAPASGTRMSWGGLDVLVFIGWLMLCMFYYVYFWQRIGQTVGMKTWRLQTLDQHCKPMSYRQGWYRALLAIISFSAGGLGYWYALIDPHRQTLHDRISKTFTAVIPKHVD